MTVLKIIGGAIGSLVVLVGLMFAFGVVDLAFFKFFAPKKENIRREVFEGTQSYVHGKVQDLAKYYEEYSKADENGKEAVRQIIIMRFAEFDGNKIQSVKLRSFLTSLRGY